MNDCYIRGVIAGTEQAEDPVGGHTVEVTRVQCYHDSIIVEPWEMTEPDDRMAALERVVEAARNVVAGFPVNSAAWVSPAEIQLRDAVHALGRVSRDHD